MSFEVDEEILQDFLVEAGEILEQLSEQLVDLEQNPDDKALLNAIFRGFHTVKGGAGFLQLTALVDCCHYAENVFDILRNGQRKIDSDLMDIVLQALDAVNEMFDTVRAGGEPEPADPALISALSAYATPPSEDEVQAVEEEPDSPEPEIEPEPVEAPSENESIDSAEGDVDISDDEFESLLDALGGSDTETSANEEVKEDTSAESGDDITEDEFDALLDQLHGAGAPGISESAADNEEASSPDSDEITEDEFEALLDKLHGESGSPSKQNDSNDSGKASNSSDAASDLSSSSDLITEDEFESLLDSLQDQKKEQEKKAETPKQPEASKQSEAPKQPEKPKAQPKAAVSKPAAQPASKAANTDTAKEKVSNSPVTQEATVRVDTKRLDDIMNMVGELVLVRNRLVRLGLQSEDESMSKAVSNLDVVTG